MRYNGKTARVPLSEQITEMLIRDIHTGKLPDGERLPPERIMARALEISVGTLRKSLSALVERGLLERIQGSGNYIRKPPDVNNVYALFRLELVKGPAQPSAKLLTIRRLIKPGFLPTMSHTRHAFRFRRLRTLDGKPAAIEEIWLDGRFADSIDEFSISESLYQFYQQQLGLRITRVEDRVSVSEPPHWTPDAFTGTIQGNLNCNCGYIERLSRDQHGLLAEFSKTWFDPANVRFVSR